MSENKEKRGFPFLKLIKQALQGFMWAALIVMGAIAIPGESGVILALGVLAILVGAYQLLKILYEVSPIYFHPLKGFNALFEWRGVNGRRTKRKARKANKEMETPKED